MKPGPAPVGPGGTLRLLSLNIQFGLRSSPSWRPSRALDHILVTPTVEVVGAQVLEERLSDHLAIASEIRLRLEPVT